MPEHNPLDEMDNLFLLVAGAQVDWLSARNAAQQCYTKALAILEEATPGSLRVAMCLLSLAHVEHRRGNPALAERLASKALEIGRQLAPGSLVEANSLFVLGIVAEETGQVERAVDLLRGAIDALEAQTGKLGGTQEVRAEFCRDKGIDVNRRITGGGAIFFDASQIGWEVVCRRSFFDTGVAGTALFRRLCEPVVAALGQLGIEAEYRPRNDIEVKGRKISGTGGTEEGEAFLFQGTLLVDFDADNLPSPDSSHLIQLPRRNGAEAAGHDDDHTLAVFLVNGGLCMFGWVQKPGNLIRKPGRSDHQGQEWR